MGFFSGLLVCFVVPVCGGGGDFCLFVCLLFCCFCLLFVYCCCLIAFERLFELLYVLICLSLVVLCFSRMLFILNLSFVIFLRSVDSVFIPYQLHLSLLSTHFDVNLFVMSFFCDVIMMSILYDMVV